MQITTIDLDIAKNVFQVHGVDAEERSSSEAVHGGLDPRAHRFSRLPADVAPVIEEIMAPVTSLRAIGGGAQCSRRAGSGLL
jgi:hypothetical protein